MLRRASTNCPTAYPTCQFCCRIIFTKPHVYFCYTSVFISAYPTFSIIRPPIGPVTSDNRDCAVRKRINCLWKTQSILLLNRMACRLPTDGAMCSLLHKATRSETICRVRRESFYFDIYHLIKRSR
jgi:hypothetical protein